MTTLGETAKAYKPQQTKNIVDLDVVDVSELVEDDLFTFDDEGEGKEIKQKVLVRDGEKYRVPNSVLKSLKAILEKRPTLKTFQVIKSGEGLKTAYTVLPVE